MPGAPEREFICYPESADGIHRVEPELATVGLLTRSGGSSTWGAKKDRIDSV